MDTQKHPNSHIVYIRRAPMFATSSRKELEEYYSESHKGIGSYFTKGGMRTATGITITEENLLLPYILNIPQEDRDFRREVTTYFQNLETKIPAHKTNSNGVEEGGRPFEIGLSGDNNIPVSDKNLPLNIEDYIRYNHAIGHPFTGENEAVGKGNPLKSFYVYDPEAVSKDNIDINEQRDKALSQYLVIKDKPTKVNMYLTLLGVNVATIKRGEEQMRLRTLADKNPVAFLEVFGDKDKETKYMIEDMINHKILERVGKNILLSEKDGGEIIGRDMREAVLYLKDARNSRILTLLRAKQQDIWRKSSISVDTDEDLELVGAELRANDVPNSVAESTEQNRDIKIDKKASTAGTASLDEVE